MADPKQRSARSQRSLLRQHELQVELAKHESHAAAHRRKISELESSKKTILGLLSKGKGGNAAGLDEGLRATNHALTDTGDKLAYSEGEIARLAAEIKALDLTPEQAKKRALQQDQLSSLAAERLAKDREVESAADALRRILQERAQLTAKIASCADALEITLGADGLDTVRAEQLVSALPEQFAAESERWAAALHGTREGLQTYVVRAQVLVIPETLAHHGVYHRGEKIDLPEREARELLGERPAATLEAPWRRAAPQLVTPEAYAEAQARAEQTGISVEDAWAYENLDREKQARAAHEAQRAPQRSYPLPATAIPRRPSVG